MRPAGVDRLSRQRAYTARRVALLLLVFVTVCLGLVYFVGDLTKYQQAISAEESRAALRGINDPQELEQVVKQQPSNKILRLVALAAKDSIAIDAASQKLLDEAEPRGLARLTDLGASSRNDLDALRQQLKTAQSNTEAVKPRYIAVVKSERDKIVNEARSLNVGADAIATFIGMIEQQHTEMTSLTFNRLTARAEYYSAYEKCVAILVREFGIYQVAKGQLIFPFRSTAESYNRAAAAMDAAEKRFSELADERTRLRQSQLNTWKNFIDRL